jgi:transposase
MDIVHTHCAGLDVHKKTVVAAIIVPDQKGGLHKETRTFETMTADLLALSDWLMGQGVTHVLETGLQYFGGQL